LCLFLLIAATIIVTISLWYTHQLSQIIAEEEQKKVALIADAYRQLNSANENTDISFLFEIIRNNATVPVILVDDNEQIIAFRNLDSLRAENDSSYLKKKLVQMKESKEPIEIIITDELKNYIYYEDSHLLTQLRYYPYFQFGIIGIFLIVSYIAFSAARKAEQDQVWVGMSKETAHQLGTPISSLSAWIEHLKKTAKNQTQTDKILAEITDDISRLELIADRFSKIGSKPDLKENKLKPIFEHTISYLKSRSSEQVKFTITTTKEDIKVRIDPALFNWVIENLLKNALDAMSGEGAIKVSIFENTSVLGGSKLRSAYGRQSTVIDIMDSGKGIPKSNFKTIFQPGFTTKQRGWGLGLSLCKRIIENYHAGKIFVKESTIGKGTTFRIILPKS